MSIIQNVKRLAESKGVSIPELGTTLGIGKSAVYKWDESSPKTETLQKVADYFNVSIDQLVYGFNRPLFAATLLMIKHGRTLEQFAKDIGTDIAELNTYLEGTAQQQPSTELIEKLITDNPIGFMLSAGDIYKHAGYDVPEQYKNQPLSPIPTENTKKELDETESELLRIYNKLSIRGKAVLLSYAYELEEEENKKSQHQ